MIQDTFLGPLYTLRVNSLGPEHALKVSCLCGAGPWYLHGFWLRQRHPSSEHLHGIVERLRCPTCTTVDAMAWTIVEAVDENSGPHS